MEHEAALKMTSQDEAEFRRHCYQDSFVSGEGKLSAGAIDEADVGRAILHVDVDCFYCQVEEMRDSTIRGLPVGVTQKYLVVQPCPCTDTSKYMLVAYIEMASSH